MRDQTLVRAVAFGVRALWFITFVPAFVVGYVE